METILRAVGEDVGCELVEFNGETEPARPGPAPLAGQAAVVGVDLR
jgi:hypothetical protein